MELARWPVLAHGPLHMCVCVRVLWPCPAAGTISGEILQRDRQLHRELRSLLSMGTLAMELRGCECNTALPVPYADR
jgi:hypothetical protein